ncbi:MAG: DUF3828 domain-containing protein [Anaerolineales bacterium]|jgi:hypothetical protein
MISNSLSQKNYNSQSAADRDPTTYVKLVQFAGALTLAIAMVGCSTASAQPAQSPEKVVSDFYAWYLENLGYDAETDEFRNPLQDGSYQDQGALSSEFIERIEEMKTDGLPADPLLCAQDVPQSFSIKQVDLSPMGEEARVSVETSFEGHEFQVYLQKLAGEWKIAGVICMPNN